MDKPKHVVTGAGWGAASSGGRGKETSANLANASGKLVAFNAPSTALTSKDNWEKLTAPVVGSQARLHVMPRLVAVGGCTLRLDKVKARTANSSRTSRRAGGPGLG
jgi:hypothetical protein